jgi:hypothetical protein
MMGVEITISDGFDEQRHQRSREEHTQRVLKGEGELLVISRGVFLQVCEVVKDMAHDKLVEDNDQDQSSEDDDSGPLD